MKRTLGVLVIGLAMTFLIGNGQTSNENGTNGDLTAVKSFMQCVCLGGKSYPGIGHPYPLGDPNYRWTV